MYAIMIICLMTFLSDLTPGSNFWKIVNHSINDSRRKCLVFVIGLVSGSVVHCLLGFIGVSAVVISFEHGLTIIQVLGGIYISWYGLKLLFTKDEEFERRGDEEVHNAKKTWIDGVLTNLANPKTILFYASMFGVTAGIEESGLYSFACVVAILMTSLLTNSSIAYLFSIERIRLMFMKIRRVFSKFVGGMFFVAGLNIVFQKR